MPTVTIDGKEYDLDDLSAAAKEQLASLQFVQSELKRLESQIAVFKTAQLTYAKALGEEINK